MVITFRTAVLILLELTSMNHLMAAAAFDPAAEAVFCCRLNFNFLLRRKKAHGDYYNLIINSMKPLIDIFPVDDIPNIFYIFSTDIHILQIISMFPYINS